MNMLKLSSQACLIVGLILLGACSPLQPIHNVTQAYIPTLPDGATPPRQDIRKAIIEAVAFKRWRIKDIDDDTFEANISVRQRHHATIRIDYSESSYDITLVNSSGLEQANGNIHRNYNKWIIELDRVIQKHLRAIRLGKL